MLYWFSRAQNTTGEGIATILIETLKEVGIDIEKMRGQGYDGCGSMAGKINASTYKKYVPKNSIQTLCSTCIQNSGNQKLYKYNQADN